MTGLIWQVYLMVAVCLVAQSCLTLCDPMDCSQPASPAHGDSSGKNTRVGCHALLVSRMEIKFHF